MHYISAEQLIGQYISEQEPSSEVKRQDIVPQLYGSLEKQVVYSIELGEKSLNAKWRFTKSELHII